MQMTNSEVLKLVNLIWIFGVQKNSEFVVEIQGNKKWKKEERHQVLVPWISEGFLGFIPRIGEVDL